jgi:uncharacterized damage-inducible protein DinB
MNREQLYIIGERDGLSTHIARLVSMMDYARHTTLQMVRHLRPSELDLLPDPTGNSIGMLLEHMAAVEVAYQASSFAGRDELTAAELERWQAGLDLGPLGRQQIRGHEIGYYLQNLATVRAQTLHELRQRDDAWLHSEFPFWGQTGNHYFCWFHVFEDEINHRGQIRLLLKQIPRYANRGLLGLQPISGPNDLGMTIGGVVAGGASEQAGLQAGDVVVAWDGLNIENTPVDEVDIVGEVGTSAFLTIKRNSESALLQIEVVRAARQ